MTSRTSASELRLAVAAAGGDVGLSHREACALAGIGRTKLFQEVKAGRLKSIKRGKRRLFLPAHISAWLNDQPAGEC